MTSCSRSGHGIWWLLLSYSLSLLCPHRCSFRVDLGSTALHTSGHHRGCRRSLTTASWNFSLLRSRSPRNSMSSQVEQARDRNLTRNLVAALGSSCSHQAAYVRHAVDSGSLCSIDSVSTISPSLLSQTNFVVQRFPRRSLPYSCEERQVASAILLFQRRRRE